MTKTGIVARLGVMGAVSVIILFSVFRYTGLAVLPTSDEWRRVLPGDALVYQPADVVMHAVTVDAPPACVWSWLAQMGAGRAGWYSYDWVDNDNHPSATRIVPLLQKVSPGDIFPALPSAKTYFIVGVVTPERDLVLIVPSPDGTVMVSWEFYLEASGRYQTRLLVRGRVSEDWPGHGDQRKAKRPIETVYRVLARTPHWLMDPAAEFGHGIMQARQLQQIKQRAEAGCQAHDALR